MYHTGTLRVLLLPSPCSAAVLLLLLGLSVPFCKTLNAVRAAAETNRCKNTQDLITRPSRPGRLGTELQPEGVLSLVLAYKNVLWGVKVVLLFTSALCFLRDISKAGQVAEWCLV